MTKYQIEANYETSVFFEVEAPSKNIAVKKVEDNLANETDWSREALIGINSIIRINKNGKKVELLVDD